MLLMLSLVFLPSNDYLCTAFAGSLRFVSRIRGHIAHSSISGTPPLPAYYYGACLHLYGVNSQELYSIVDPCRIVRTHATRFLRQFCTAIKIKGQGRAQTREADLSSCEVYY